MRTQLFALATLALAACVSGDRACQNDVDIDELTGQVTLNGGERCSAMPFGLRPEAVEMTVLVLDETDDLCAATDLITTYHVEGLKNDLDFGPADPPDEAETVVDDTADLEVGTAIQLILWDGAMFSEGRRTIDEWSRSFLWGVEDSVEPVECFLG